MKAKMKRISPWTERFWIAEGIVLAYLSLAWEIIKIKAKKIEFCFWEIKEGIKDIIKRRRK